VRVADDDPWRSLVALTGFADELVSEHEHHSLLHAGMKAGVPDELIRRALALEPDRIMATSVIFTALERVPDSEHHLWLEVAGDDYSAPLCLRRSTEISIARRAERGELTVAETERSLSSWSGYLQRRLSEGAIDPDVLAVLAVHGETRRVRAAADRRNARLLGRILSKLRTAELLDMLCADLGHCVPAAARQRLIDEIPADKDAFTDDVLRAQGLDPLTYDPGARRELRRAIVVAFGRGLPGHR
jgi:hypothetical protein